jgi:soluble lytic murein transglycosylase-like protein
MLNEKMKKWDSVTYRLVSALPYLLTGCVVIIGLVLMYTATSPARPVNAGYPASLSRNDADVRETTKQAVLHWMKENSEMPEHVLSKIYGVAVGSVNPDLVLAICLVESNFNPHVESEKGAIGLMGIMPDVWIEELKAHGIVKGEEDLYTISSNINAGIYVLGRYLARTNNLREALNRYAGRDPNYAARVLRMLGEVSQARRSEMQTHLASLRTDG